MTLSVATLAIGLAAAHAQPAPNEQLPAVGDSPENPGPYAVKLSTDTNPAAVKAAMRKVADWQLGQISTGFSQDWTFAALDVGLLAASDALHDRRYQRYVIKVSDHFDWKPGPRKSHADDQAIGQSYLWLYNEHRKTRRIEPLRREFDEVMQLPDDPSKPLWWWCDALFMAPPAWAQLASIAHEPKYLDYMDREWRITSDLLWDSQEHLFYRDSSYIGKQEKNGSKIFWSRGNGWVMAGLVRVLTFLPPDDPRRPFYEEKLREMAEKVRGLQGEDGLWRPGLLDENDYPYPEISGSAFFVYATAWSINHGLLNRSDYLPVVQRGWKGLVSHIYEDGRLGSIQPIGAAPDAYKPGSSYVFGTGAFLLAGSEVIQINMSSR